MPSSATSNPVEAKASQLGTSSSGITRMALPSAKNRVATSTKRRTGVGWAGRSVVAAIAPMFADDSTTRSVWASASNSSSASSTSTPR